LPQTGGNDTFTSLKGHECISLTTFRINGKPVATPVRFVYEDGKLYVATRKGSGKIKRIQNNQKVQLAPCTLRGKIVGPTTEGMARILPAGESALAVKALESNQSILMRIGIFFVRLRSGNNEWAILEIVPIIKEK
jgi:PPOX class probable F420-dependent enzyme